MTMTSGRSQSTAGIGTVVPLAMADQGAVDGILAGGVGEDVTRRRLEGLRTALTLYYDGFLQHDAAAAKIRQDEALSPIGRKSQLAPLREEFKAASESRLSDIVWRVEGILGHYRDQVRLPSPAEDPALAEAMLANARADAQMFLGNATRRLDGDEALMELARTGGPAVRALLLDTDWGSQYLRSTGEEKLIPGWQAAREDLRRQLLPDSGKAALAMLQRLAPLEKVPVRARGAREFYLLDTEPAS